MAAGILGALLQAGMDMIVQEGKQPQPAAGAWTGMEIPSVREVGEKLEQKMSLWGGRFVFKDRQQQNIKRSR